MEQGRRMFNFTKPKRAGTASMPETPLPTGNMTADQAMSPQSTCTMGPRQSQESASRQSDGRQTVGATASNNESHSYAQSLSRLQTTSNTNGDDSSYRLLEQEESIIWGGSRFGTEGGSHLAANLTRTIDTTRSTEFAGLDDSSGVVNGGAYGPNADEIQRPDGNAERNIILAINFRGRRLGCAYFDTQLSKLFVMQDMVECKSLDVVETIKMQVRPTLVFTTSRLDEDIMELLKVNSFGHEIKVEVRPNGDFSSPLGKSKLLSVMINSRRAARPVRANGIQSPLAGMADEATQKEVLMLLSNIIDIQSVESIGCAGAIIGYLSRNGIAHRNTHDGRSLTMFNIASFSIDNFMFINPNAMSSLQIFEDEAHPCMHSSIRGRKEGLSLFGITNTTRTAQGRYLLKQWFLRPSLDMDIILSRHRTVGCFLRPEHSVTVDQLATCLSHIKNMPKILLSLHRRVNISEWQAIHQFTYYSIKICNLAQDFVLHDSPILHQIQEQFATQDLMEVATMINNILDFDESVVEGRCVVKHNVDEHLDEMRRTYQGLDSFLSHIAKEISETIPTEFTHAINVIYFPQLGYLVAVPMNSNWKTPEDFELEGLSFQFKTEHTVYYKNDKMRQLDEDLGDLHGLIVDREIDILQALQERIQEYELFLFSCSEVCSELDALLALSYSAKLHNYKQPVMTHKTVLCIEKGRHPLQELSVDAFVPNDTRLGDALDGPDDSSASTTAPQTLTNDGSRFAEASSETSEYIDNRVMILCGANCSGKSVYLKQVALITYMAHIGSFVPAESATIGITDKILTRLQTCDTNQSVFMTDLQQVSLALRLSTKRSLVLLDEFGKGTTSADGAGLFCGSIEHFATRSAAERPKVVATTHFHELFENRLLDTSLPISFHMMEIYQEFDDQDATFLFRVVPGKNPSSLGPACAASSGVPMHVVKRGAYLSKQFRRHETVVPIMSEHELDLMTMYEALVRMLVSLDLHQNLDIADGKGKQVARNGPPKKAAATDSTTQRVPNHAKGTKEDDIWSDERIQQYYESDEAAQDLDLLLNFDMDEFADLKAAAAGDDKNALEKQETDEEAEARRALAVHAEIDEMLDLAAQVARLEKEHTVVLNSSSSEYEDEDDDEY
ncbi:MutS protein msh5 [Podila verticillata]|nr:MutS protein msh5 [Podila verticillata]